MTRAHGLSREERLRRPADFERAFKRRCMAANAWLRVHGCENSLKITRLGLSVGRKWGNAPCRNRIRRLYREAFRLSKPALPVGLDLVLVPQKVAQLSLNQLLESFPSLVKEVASKLKRKKASDEQPDH